MAAFTITSKPMYSARANLGGTRVRAQRKLAGASAAPMGAVCAIEVGQSSVMGSSRKQNEDRLVMKVLHTRAIPYRLEDNRISHFGLLKSPRLGGRSLYLYARRPRSGGGTVQRSRASVTSVWRPDPPDAQVLSLSQGRCMVYARSYAYMSA
jgi:hypothetical protein